LKTLNKIKDRVIFKEGDMWIGKNDYLLKKATLLLEFTVNDDISQKAKIELQAKFANFNKNQNILEPTTSIPIESVLNIYDVSFFNSP
jgi:hypothetical protein